MTKAKKTASKKSDKASSKKTQADAAVTSAVTQKTQAQVVQQPDPLSPFTMDEDELRTALVATQYALRETRHGSASGTQSEPVQATGLLVLVNGMEMAGKGEAVTQLRQWVDPRLLKVEATVGYPPPPSQPIWQAHTEMLPRHGDVMVYFGNWYADLIRTAMLLMQAQASSKSDNKKTSKKGGSKKSDKTDSALEGLKAMQSQTSVDIYESWQDYLTHQLDKLRAFEHDLTQNQTKLLKCWFHIDKETLDKRLHDDIAEPVPLYHMDWADEEMLARFNDIASEILSQQDDWIIIDGSDQEQATMQFCHHVLHAMQEALVESGQAKHQSIKPKDSAFVWADIPDKLTDIEDPDMDKSDYKKQLADKQAQLAHLLRERDGRHVVFAFEGMDAAGKGGSIKRLVAPLDPREYQIYNIGAPMQYELDHPYLWRFWTRLPTSRENRISRVAIFDRTWYGRVLVERVEGFANEMQWQRAFEEINRFEADLADSGTLVIKYWLAIDKAEQLERFEDRKETPHKQFKLTDDDWRNRDKWKDYVQAASDMLARTNTKIAPWCVVATNDKRTARLLVLDHAIAQLTAMLSKH